MDLRLRAFVVAVSVLVPSLAHAQAAQPPAGAWLRYRYEQRLVDGAGEYEGYQESTVADARYEVLASEPSRARIRGEYVWTYRSPERTESESVTREVEFTLPDRRYVGPQTDSTDYDAYDARELATWIWVSPSVQAGEQLAILDRSDFVVLRRDETATIAGSPRSVIVAGASYASTRDDEYGRFDTNVSDTYWFDAATGMFLREEVIERNTGSLGGRPAAFTFRTTVEVVDASYAPAATPPPAFDPTPERDESDGGLCASNACCIVLGLGAVGLALALGAARRRARRTRGGMTADGREFRITPLGAADGPAPPELSTHFGELLAHLAAVTRDSGNEVLAARSGADGRVIGVALADKQSAVGSIFASDPDVCEALRRASGHTEFFSELRHGALASVTRAGLSAPPQAYNVYETYDVLELRRPPEDLGYDTQVVGGMRDDEQAAVAALLTEVYRVPCDRWLSAALAHGDLVWVARDGGKVVGAAMASVVGSTARLHSLTVHPSARQRGLGTALYRARLRALRDLGAARVITECATWNLAACELARAHGFEPVGQVYVETSRSEREERHFVRR